MATVVEKCGIEREKGWLYYLDKQGDVSRTKMSRGGTARKKKRKKKDDDAGGTVARDEVVSELEATIRLRPGEKANPLPKTVADLEKDWLRWVKAKYPGFKDGLPAYPAK